MDFKDVIQYFKHLAEQHSSIRHDDKGECHFSSLPEDAQNKFARRMHYPCMTVVKGNIDWMGAEQINKVRDLSLIIADHVRDTGDYVQVQKVLDDAEKILDDCIKRMCRDRRKGVSVMQRFNLSGAEAVEVYLEDAALYGWAFLFNLSTHFTDIDCDHPFIDEQPQTPTINN